MASFAVLGATSWGVTLAWLLARNGNAVHLLVRSDAEAASVANSRGISRLPEVTLQPSVAIHTVPFASACDGLVVAVPAQSLRESLAASGVSRQVPVLTAAKGIELASGLRMTGVVASLGWDAAAIGVLSGPNLAHEIAAGLPAAAVAASQGDAQGWQAALSGGTFRVYTSDDVVGVELAGALKNVIAIAAGAGWGLNFGTNAVASLMTRGLAEMTRLGVALGADPLTFQGLAGVGDLAATCFSPLSRNRRFGELLAMGRSPDEARLEIGETVEGAATAGVALELARTAGVELPICAVVARVVSGEISVAEAMARLLARPLRQEAGSDS